MMHNAFYTHLATNHLDHVLMSERGQVEVRVSHEDFKRLLDNHEASIDYDWHAPGEIALRNALCGRTLKDFTPSQIARATLKQKLCDKYIVEDAAARLRKERVFLNDDFQDKLDLWCMQLQKKKKGERSDTALTFKPISVTTFREDLKRYKEVGLRLEGLLPRYHGPGAFPICDDADSYRLWKQHARGYISDRKPTVAYLHRMLLGDIESRNPGRIARDELPLVAPSIKKFRKMIAKLNQFEVKAGRDGLEAAARYYHKIQQNYDVVRPGQRVEMDSHVVDLKSFLVESELWFQFDEEAKAEIVVSNVRIWFVTAIDAATRECLALKAGFSANSDAATAALRMIMSDKTYLSDLVDAKTPWAAKLLPEEIDFDNGSEFLEGEFRQKLLSCGINATTPSANEPPRRPFIESLIGTFSEKMCAHFDGRTFSSIAEKGDYNAEDRTVLTVEEVAKVAILVICDDYHNAPHEGLGGNSPHNEFHSLCKIWPPHYPPSRKRLREVFGHKSLRKIHPYGVVFWGVTYNSDELQRHRQKHGQTQIEVRVDPYAIDTISVLLDGEWIEVENELGIDDTVTLAEWVYALRQEVSENGSATLAGLKVVYATMNRLREMGLAAQLRAGIEPDVLDPVEFARLEDKVLGGTRFERPAAPIAIVAYDQTDPLRGLQIGSGLPITRAPKIPTAAELAAYSRENTSSQFGTREEL
jgi:transposase InsO family protein